MRTDAAAPGEGLAALGNRLCRITRRIGSPGPWRLRLPALGRLLTRHARYASIRAMTAPAPAIAAPIAAADRQAAAEGLIALGADMHARGWSLATSSNYSVRLSSDPLRLLVTASGKHKDRLTADDFVLINGEGQPVEPGAPKSSAETLLHTTLARYADAGAIVHTHSVWGTLLSDRHGPDGVVTIAGYEMLKALPGVGTHDTAVDLAIFPNTQDIAALSEELAERLGRGDSAVRYGFLIHKHGLYTWDSDLNGARRCVEALEFLFECEGRRDSR